MPAFKPVRPAAGADLALPAVEDEATQRALDRVDLVVDQLVKKLDRIGDVHSTRSVQPGTAAAAPTTGTWKRGDRVYNEDPVAGGFIGWVCLVGGTPGIWRAFGAIQP